MRQSALAAGINEPCVCSLHAFRVKFKALGDRDQLAQRGEGGDSWLVIPPGLHPLGKG